MIFSLIPLLVGGGTRAAVTDASGAASGSENDDFEAAFLAALTQVDEMAEAVAAEATQESWSEPSNAEVDEDVDASSVERLAEQPTFNHVSPPQAAISQVAPDASERAADAQVASDTQVGEAISQVAPGSQARAADPPVATETQVGAAISPVAPQVAPPSTDVGRTSRSLRQLDPELRTRVERVIARMAADYGHEVELVEGYRTPERQAHLFEQGRSRSGPVVTWTRESAHTAGRAADLRVDGGYEDVGAYARLQYVARAEGLVTLGMRDRGHVELPESQLSRSLSGLPAQSEGLEAGLRVGLPHASPARNGVVAVAQVATVAQVARVARPGAPTRGASRPVSQQAIPEAPSPFEAPVLDLGELRTAQAATAEAASRAAATGETMPPAAGVSAQPEANVAAAPLQPGATGVDQQESRRASKATAQRESTEAAPDAGAETRAAALDVLSRGTEGAIRATQASREVAGVDQLQRVERVLEAQELARSFQPGRVTLRLDGSAGTVGQLRIGLLGNTVDAQLDLTDAAAARLMRSRVDELHMALESRGLELGALGITATPGADAATEGWLGARGDTTTELLRTLLGGSAADTGRGDAERQRDLENQRMSRDRAGSERSRRDDAKEQRK